METNHSLKLEKRMQEDGKDWIAEVINLEQGFKIITKFDSENHNFEDILHKINLDLMTNLHNGFINPIAIRIKEKKK